jgi:hypothetical protein
MLDMSVREANQVLREQVQGIVCTTVLHKRSVPTSLLGTCHGFVFKRRKLPSLCRAGKSQALPQFGEMVHSNRNFSRCIVDAGCRADLVLDLRVYRGTCLSSEVIAHAPNQRILMELPVVGP